MELRMFLGPEEESRASLLDPANDKLLKTQMQALLVDVALHH